MQEKQPRPGDIYSSNTYVWFPDNRVVRMSPLGGFFVHACIHPDGTSAVFWGGTEGFARIWWYDFSGKIAEPITPAESGAIEPSYDWTGSRIVFASDRAVDPPRESLVEMAEAWRARTYSHRTAFSLYVADADGGHPRRITFGEHLDLRPSFSPDGGTVVFVSTRGGAPQLWSVASDGSSEPVRLQKSGWAYRPWFSTDGRWIFFLTELEGRHRICRMASTGGDFEPLANETLGRSHGPFADVDGEHLWLHSVVDGRLSIYRLPLGGGAPVRWDPPGFTYAAHATRARNGTMTFDSRDDPTTHG